MLSAVKDSKEIRVVVMDGPTIRGRGQGPTRKKAEQMAAKEALETVGAVLTA
jgi:dsRNA-specific ribonuclease